MMTHPATSALCGAAPQPAPNCSDAYEISFTRYSYKLPALRTLEEIRAGNLAPGEGGRGAAVGEIIGTRARRSGAIAGK
jgi:hypothetical protein